MCVARGVYMCVRARVCNTAWYVGFLKEPTHPWNTGHTAPAKQPRLRTLHSSDGDEEDDGEQQQRTQLHAVCAGSGAGGAAGRQRGGRR